MRRLRAFVLRLRGLIHTPARAREADDDFAAELESHVALHVEEGMRAGLSGEEARRQALLKLGGVEQVRQAYRERSTLPWLENLVQDLRYGVRTLRRSPGFAITAVLTLALGIGACTAVFSLVNAVLLRSLPYGEPERLVYLYTPIPIFHLPAEVFSPSNADFLDIERQSHSYADMTLFGQSVFNLGSSGKASRVLAARVDANFFSTLGALPELGRAIAADDQQPGNNHVAVISRSLWQSLFAGSPDVLKDSISLDGEPYRVVGVMAAGFEYPGRADLPYGNAQVKTTQVWIPLALTPQQKAERDNSNADAAVARLRTGVTLRQAQAELSTIMAGLDKLHDPEMRGWGGLAESFIDTAIGPVRPLMKLLLGAALLVLLIACANAASLLLARASDRLGELGVRAALGADRSRIVRQLLTESLLIGSAAGVFGVGLAYAFLRALPHLDPGNIPRLGEASLDARVLLFTVSVSVLTSLLSGILPALTVSRLNLAGFLSAGSSRAVAGRHSRMQSALIVAEAAMVVVLMTGAGLLIRSYINVASVDTGFSASTVTMNISLDKRTGDSPQHQASAHREFFQSLIRRLGSLPGVTAAGAVSDLPLSGAESISMVQVDGFPNRKQQDAEARSITPDYFRAMGIPLVAGRFFSDDDIASGAHVAIVNQRFAQIYFANRNPIGGRISGDGQHWNSVVGVVADVRHTNLEEAPQPQIYNPNYEFGSAYIAVRSTLPAATVANEVRPAVRALDPDVAVANIRTMGELESEASARRRFQTTLLTVFAGVALLLALAGIYGLMSYSVSRREREVGIRMALGAQRADVMLMVIKNAAGLMCLGVAAGLGCAWFAARAMRAFLFEVGDHDPATLVIVCLLLAVCGLIAALVPARRAASVDPMRALRAE
jgi:predicted permease